DMPRIRALIGTQVRAGASVYTILEKVDKAALRQFSPKGYERADYECKFLILKMEGTSAANVAHRSLGLPSIDATKRHIATVPLQASARFPTHQELSSNLQQCYPPEGVSPDQPIYGMSIQYDELKVQERLRWDPCTNNILGLCREHSKPYALEFRSMDQTDAIAEALRQKEVHLATEVTVIGSSILCEMPHKYVTKPFGMSGSCKQETLRPAVDDLEPQNSIYSSLSQLPLFNLRCGDDSITADFDWKHVFKRFRNTAIRQKGFKLNGRTFSAPILREYLKSLGMSDVTINSLLSPNDKQDVTLMMKLLRSVSQLASETEDTANPLSRSTREMLRLLGRLYGHLLNAYLDISLSLHQQLAELSAAGHLILALYHQDKGDFIPVQTYFDVMCMIKNVYFCVAKAQRDNPAGRFFIILLGTDGLEKIFGKVRTMVGNDTNADVFQLTNRIDGAVKCVNILERHPEWGGDARRLNVKPLKDKDVEITSAYDHLNPSAFTGDLRVSSVVLLESWTAGRRPDMDDLASAADIAESRHTAAPSAYLSLDSANASLKPIHKSSILRIFSDPLTINESRDRLKRVRGYSWYNEVKDRIFTSASNASAAAAEDSLDVQDPAITLVYCERNPEDADWEWNGNFESQSMLCELNGRFVEQMDPNLQPASRGRNIGEETYVFKTSELRAIAAMMYERLEKETLLKLPVTDSFPYRDACFVCEKDTADGQLHRVEGLQTCSRCPNFKIGTLGGQDLLKHMGSHILNDPSMLGADNPCGLCLNTGSLCEI
ncbi:hypothetical protein BJ912DRAFT_801995, partial [Pholiota molesta]